MITIPLKILLVENNKVDIDLIIYHIHRIVETLDVHVVEPWKPVIKHFSVLCQTWLFQTITCAPILGGANGFILKGDMENLNDKLKPYLKRIVFNMDAREGIREKIRQ
ncbi:hypothetical protein BH23BAC2_BH23BAC2_22010 [soil metagenome]